MTRHDAARFPMLRDQVRAPSGFTVWPGGAVCHGLAHADARRKPAPTKALTAHAAPRAPRPFTGFRPGSLPDRLLRLLRACAESGAPLPPAHALALDARTSATEVRAAIGVLEQRGLLRQISGRPVHRGPGWRVIRLAGAAQELRSANAPAWAALPPSPPTPHDAQ